MRRFVAALFMLSGLMVAGGAKAVVYLDATNTLSYSGSLGTSSDSVAPDEQTMTITSGSVDVDITSIQLNVESFSYSFTGNLILKVYPADSGNVPILSTVYFTQTIHGVNFPSPAQYVSINPTGLTLLAGTKYTVSVSAQNSTPVDFFFKSQTYSPATNSGFIYGESGLVVGSAYNSFAGQYVSLFEISGTTHLAPAPAPSPSAVPTLSEWSQLLLGLLVLSMIGWHFHRERSF